LAAGWSQESLAQEIGTSTGAVRAWESGIRFPLPRNMEPLARALGLTVPQLNRVLDPAAPISLNGDALQPGGALHAVAEWLSMFVKAEQGAREARIFEAITMPALLQTRRYATWVEQVAHRPVTGNEVSQLVEMRLARQAVLDRRPEPIRLAVVMPESVLHEVAGSTEVMVEQLDHVIELAQRPHLDIRVVAAGGGRLLCAPGSFTVLTTAGAPSPDLACSSDVTGFRYHENPQVVHDFTDLFDHLANLALSPFESHSLIKNIREDHRR
jgi:transcriptional regulator with XRE-family HTH domain